MDSHSVGQVPETGIANVTSHCLRSLLSQVVGNPVTVRRMERLSHPGQMGEGFQGRISQIMGESMVTHQVTRPAKKTAQILNMRSHCQSCCPGT